MSNQIFINGAPTGRVGGSSGGFYVAIYNEAGQVWNGSSFQSVSVVTWTTIGVNLSETGSTGQYIGTCPASIPDQMLTFEVLEQFSSSKNILNDKYTGGYQKFWDGTSLLDPTVGPLGDETYAPNGQTFTLKDALYMIYAMRTAVVTGTTFQAKGLNGTTTKMTFTLDSATNPTQMIRAT